MGSEAEVRAHVAMRATEDDEFRARLGCSTKSPA